jgi:hypothetical protein
MTKKITKSKKKVQQDPIKTLPMKYVVLILVAVFGLALILNRALPRNEPDRQALPTATVRDCGGGNVGLVTITNKSNYTVQNCNITSGGIAIIDSSFITIRNVTITNVGTQSGAIRINASSQNGLTHDIIVEDFRIFGNGNVGWGFSGSPYVMKNITVRRGLIEDVGQSASVQTHGMYISNWQSFLIEDVTILRSWNAGIKIVGTVKDGIWRNVIVKDSGRSGLGGGMMFGQSDGKLITDNLLIEKCRIENSTQPGIYLLDHVTGLTIRDSTFRNNKYAMMVSSGATDWVVTNNIGYNSVPYLQPLYVENDAMVAGNFFDYNNWYYDGANPVRFGSNSIPFLTWQAKGVDIHSISQLPVTPTATNTPVPATQTATATRTPVPATNTPIPATNTPTATVTKTRTPTLSFTPTFTATSTVSMTPTLFTPCDPNYLPEICIYRRP